MVELLRSSAVVPPAEPRRGSRYLPAFLDALIPGLGHLVAGRRARALLFVSPLLVMAGTAVLIAATTSAPRLAATLLSAEVIWGLLAAQGLLLASRLIAVGSSLFDPALPRPGRRDLLPIAILLAFVIAPQAFAGYATEVAREAADAIFVEPAEAARSRRPTRHPIRASSSTAPAEPVRVALAWRRPATGSPACSSASTRGSGRNTYLTDTMIVVSLDRSNRTVSMLSIPRDMVDVPMPDGRHTATRSTRSCPMPGTTRCSSRARTAPASTC